MQSLSPRQQVELVIQVTLREHKLQKVNLYPTGNTYMCACSTIEPPRMVEAEFIAHQATRIALALNKFAQRPVSSNVPA